MIKIKHSKIIFGVGISAFLITLLILSFLPPLEKEVIDMNINFDDILVSAFSGIIFSVGTTIFIYFKFLKHIPEETYKKIDKLLNDRINYDTTNHNATLMKVDSDSKELSREHNNIMSKVTDIDKFLYGKDKEEKDKYKNLTDTQKEISRQINTIKAINDELLKVQTELKQSQTEIARLNEIIVNLEKELDEKNLLIEQFKEKEYLSKLNPKL